MSKLALDIADQVQIKAILLQYQADGVVNPRLPKDVDIDGDGLVDAYGLDAFNRVVLHSNVPLKDTVWISEGDDVGPEVSSS